MSRVNFAIFFILIDVLTLDSIVILSRSQNIKLSNIQIFVFDDLHHLFMSLQNLD